MRRLCAILSILCGLALAGVASGVVGGTADTTHTWVGAAIQHQVHDGVSGNERCSGFLVSATKFVTAAHCFDPGGDPVRVTFAQNSLDPGATFIQVAASAVVDAPGGLDIAVITLPAQPQAFPGTGSPDGDSVDVVGYGVETISHKTPTSFGQRMIVPAKLANAGSQSDLYLKLLADPGACLGDSGGPDLNSNGEPVAINSFSNGNPNCNGVTYSLRLDNPAVQAFLTSQL
jgi:hypothetical protein